MKAVQNCSDYLLKAALAACIAVPSFVCAKVPDVATKQKPNIVFILADDMGWSDIGYNGSEIKTPMLDRLAGEGCRFTHHYSTPTCTPTRVGLMSGRYPSRFGVVAPAYGRIFDKDTVTLAEALKQDGYTTHITGKWHMGSPPDYTPLKYGFMSSYGYFAGQIDPYTHLYKTGEKTWHRNDVYLDEEGHTTDLITKEALRVINASHDQPFFLYVAYGVPHYPLNEPDKWVDQYSDIKEVSRRWFAGSVTHMDAGIAKILHALDEQGLRKNTLLIFASDNGGEKSWHSDTQYNGRYADKPHQRLGDNHPLRGWKGDCYEGAIRVPAFINWPGVISPGTIETPVHIVDWMPTLCDVAGYKPSQPLPWDGLDIWPIVTGTAAPPAERTLYWKTPHATAVRKGDWKLIVFFNDQHRELYNLKNDPFETKDLSGQESARLAELETVLEHVASGDRSQGKDMMGAPE